MARTTRSERPSLGLAGELLIAAVPAANPPAMPPDPYLAAISGTRQLDIEAELRPCPDGLFPAAGHVLAMRRARGPGGHLDRPGGVTAMTADRGFAIPALLATRTRKARRDGRCPLCPHPVRTGQRVGLVAGQWAHCSCIVRVNASRHLTPEE